MDLTSLKQLGRIEKEVEIAGFKFLLHTLTVAEQENAFEAVSGTPDSNGIVDVLKTQRALLVEATSSINGESIAKEELQKAYTEIQPRVLNQLFTIYRELTKEQEEVLGELKKN